MTSGQLAYELVQLAREGSYDPLSRLEEALRAIRRWEDRVNAFITIRDRGGLEEDARKSLERIERGSPRPLEGVLVGVKDNISTSFLPTTAASRILECYKPPYNAEVVDRLLHAGAIVVGKTNMDEFAMGSTGEYSAYGPTRNPLDPERVPGGSSSGSAAALAYSAVDLALGSDTGGSIRLPASYTGLVGLKPTYGAVSRRGLIPYANSLEQIGPMARSVRDVALLYSVIAGRDPWDSTTMDYEPPDPWSLEPLTPREARICVAARVLEYTDEDVRRVFMDFIARLDSEGYHVEEVEAGFYDHVLPAYYTIAMAEAASNLARYDGGLYPCNRPGARTWEELNVESRSRLLGPEVRRRIVMGVLVLSEGYRDEYYVLAARVRRLVRDRLATLTRDCLVVHPTAVTPPPRLGERLGDPRRMYALDIATVTANLAGVPALTVPVGEYQGLPVGAQFMAAPWREDLLFRMGLAVEEITGGAGR